MRNMAAMNHMIIHLWNSDNTAHCIFNDILNFAYASKYSTLFGKSILNYGFLFEPVAQTGSVVLCKKNSVFDKIFSLIYVVYFVKIMFKGQWTIIYLTFILSGSLFGLYIIKNINKLSPLKTFHFDPVLFWRGILL